MESLINDLIKMLNPGIFDLSKAINIHKQLDEKINDYVNKSILTTKNEIIINISNKINVLRDVKTVQNDMLTFQSDFDTLLIKPIKFKVDYYPSLFGPEMLYELNDYINDDETLPKNEKIELISSFNDIANDIKSELLNLKNDITQFELSLTTLKEDTINLATENINKLYKFHISYLIKVTKHQPIKMVYNQEVLTKLPKQSEFIKIDKIIKF